MLQRLLVLAALFLSSSFAFAQDSTPGTAQDYQAGRDYFPIEPAQPTASGDKIEVIEVFGYPCIHCANAAPVIAEWRKGLAPDVQLSFMPAVFGGIWEIYARVFYAAETMGVMERTHERLFEVLHTERRPIASVEDIATFYAEYGVSKEQFLATIESFPVGAKVANATRQVPLYQVEATPTIVVNGKYRVLAPGGEDGYQKMLQVVDFLVAKERAAKVAG